MLAGKMRHLVRIESVAQVSDGAGGMTDTWSKAANVHASIAPLRGREALEAQAINSTVTHRVMMRAYKGLSTRHRLIFRDHRQDKDRRFEILAVRNIDERNRDMEVMVVERT